MNLVIFSIEMANQISDQIFIMTKSFYLALALELNYNVAHYNINIPGMEAYNYLATCKA